MTHSEQTAWNITITGSLSAHFKQPRGPSRKGSDWSVVVSASGTEIRLFIRAYADDVRGMSKHQEAAAVIDYLKDLPASGRSPQLYQGTPGELTPPPRTPTIDAPLKPWWRFW